MYAIEAIQMSSGWSLIVTDRMIWKNGNLPENRWIYFYRTIVEARKLHWNWVKQKLKTKEHVLNSYRALVCIRAAFDRVYQWKKSKKKLFQKPSNRTTNGRMVLAIYLTGTHIHRVSIGAFFIFIVSLSCFYECDLLASDIGDDVKVLTDHLRQCGQWLEPLTGNGNHVYFVGYFFCAVVVGGFFFICVDLM